MKKYKHKKLGWTAEYFDEYSYKIKNEILLTYKEKVPKELIEDNSDWEECFENKLSITERNSGVFGTELKVEIFEEGKNYSDCPYCILSVNGESIRLTQKESYDLEKFLYKKRSDSIV